MSTGASARARVSDLRERRARRCSNPSRCAPPSAACRAIRSASPSWPRRPNAKRPRRLLTCSAPFIAGFLSSAAAGARRRDAVCAAANGAGHGRRHARPRGVLQPIASMLPSPRTTHRCAACLLATRVAHLTIDRQGALRRRGAFVIASSPDPRKNQLLAALADGGSRLVRQGGRGQSALIAHRRDLGCSSA